MSDAFRKYRKSQIAEMRPYVEGETLGKTSISEPDKQAGSPKKGDMIARNPDNHADQWLVSSEFFDKNYEPA